MSALTIAELTELLKLLREMQADTASVEAKRATTELPRRIWETLSAFANTPGGGVLLLGVDEETGFAVTGVHDAAKMQADLASVCDQMDPPLRPLIQVHRVEGLQVIAAEIPEVDYRERPCYYRGAGIMGGSFVRVADGDRRLTQYEVQTMLDGRGQPVYDLEPVPYRTRDDLDGEQLSRFLTRLRSKVDAPYANWPEDRLLRSFRIVTEHEGRLVPTLAGYLCFGSYPQEDFPGLYLSVVRYPTVLAGDPGSLGERLPDNAKAEGSIARMLSVALSAVTRNLSQRSVVVGLWRQDIPEYPIETLREAMVNALVHRDYSPLARGSPVQVRIFPDRLEVDNPGGLFGPVTADRLGEPGVQATRNAFLMKLLEDVPATGDLGVLAENRGTGITAMLAAMRRAAMTPPRFDDRRTAFRITFSNTTLLDTDALDWLSRLKDEALSDNQRLALAFARKNSTITSAEYRRLTLVDSREATRDLADLVGRGLLVQQGARRWAFYALAAKLADHRRLGAKPLPRRADRRDQILSLLKARGPLAAKEIAAMTGLTIHNVRRWLGVLRNEGQVHLTTSAAKSPTTKYFVFEESPRNSL